MRAKGKCSNSLHPDLDEDLGNNAELSQIVCRPPLQLLLRKWIEWRQAQGRNNNNAVIIR